MSTHPPRAQICLSSAKEDLQAISSAPTPGSLGSEALYMGVMVKTAATLS